MTTLLLVFFFVGLVSGFLFGRVFERLHAPQKRLDVSDDRGDELPSRH